MAEKTRYSDAELEEFRAIILEKLEKAKKDYDLLRSGVTNSDGNDVADTSPTFKVLEEGAATLSKEEAGRLAQRQMKFIQNLQAALASFLRWYIPNGNCRWCAPCSTCTANTAGFPNGNSTDVRR